MRAGFIHALAVCAEHYMERGYTLEQALEHCYRSEEDVFRVYEIIQEEKRRGCYPHTNALNITPDSKGEE